MSIKARIFSDMKRKGERIIFTFHENLKTEVLHCSVLLFYVELYLTDCCGSHF